MDFQAALSVADAAAVELPSAAGATIAIAMLSNLSGRGPGSERRDQRRRGISEIVKANSGQFDRDEQRAEFSRHVSRLIRQPNIDSCRRAGRLLKRRSCCRSCAYRAASARDRINGNAAKSA